MGVCESKREETNLNNEKTDNTFIYDETNIENDKKNSPIEKLNQMIIEYKIEKDITEVKLFGQEFVENNKCNCYLLIDGQQKELCENLILNQNQKEKDKIKIILVENKNITNMSHMFSNCKLLHSLKDISKLDVEKVYDMSHMFSDCKSLITLPGISKWEVENVKDMSWMFYSCESLKSLPDISIWNNKNVKNMSHMFSDCKSLKSLPDISKWDVEKVYDMSHMFSSCKSLKSLPDLSKWKIEKDANINDMFSFCDVEIPSLIRRIKSKPKPIYYPEYHNKVKIDFVTTNQKKFKIIINSDNTIKELIRFFFQTIKRPDLFGNDSIHFLINGCMLKHDSNYLIKKYIENKYDHITIIVCDISNKI